MTPEPVYFSFKPQETFICPVLLLQTLFLKDNETLEVLDVLVFVPMSGEWLGTVLAPRTSREVFFEDHHDMIANFFPARELSATTRGDESTGLGPLIFRRNTSLIHKKL